MSLKTNHQINQIASYSSVNQPQIGPTLWMGDVLMSFIWLELMSISISDRSQHERSLHQNGIQFDGIQPC